MTTNITTKTKEQGTLNQSALTVRNAKDRGYANHGWLKTYHSFSFASYYDPEHMGFRSLRVINDDKIAPQGGFPMHPHRDMEIFSYIVSGAISHKDTMGNERTLKPGDIQLMSTGSGIKHSEFNPSKTEELHLLQIWLTPNKQGLTPTYTEWQPNESQASSKKTLIISQDGRETSAIINQDASIYKVTLKEGESVDHELAESRGMWIQVISGEISVDGVTLSTGDAASSETEKTFNISASQPSELLLFDLA